MTIRLGVIGAGSWALSSHLPNFRAEGDVEFVAVSRLGADALKDVQERFGFAHASEDYRDVLEHDLDVVLVASPSGMHVEHASAALRSGAHVLLEKPVSTDAASAWALNDLAASLDREVVVAFGWNFRPMVRHAKALMEGHGVGTVEAVAIQMASQTRELLTRTGAYPDADPRAVPEHRTWTDRSLSGGGYGQAQLSHALGLQLWLTGQRVDAAFALMANPMTGSDLAGIELHDAVTLRYDDGAIGTMFGASNHMGAGDNKHQLQVSIYGSEGQLRVDVEREELWLYRTDGTQVRPDLEAGEGAYDCVGPVATICAAARGEAVDNQAPLELGARTVEALDLAYRSADSGRLEQR